MRSLLIRLFVENWQRKLISLILAMVIWMVVNHSMTTTKTLHNVPVRMTQLPEGKTIEGMQASGLLNERISLTLTGNQAALDDLSSRDLEVVIDASGKGNEWVESLSRKNLKSLTSHFDPIKSVSRVSGKELILKQSKLVTDRIPVVVTEPIGEAPKGYQFLDIWPYQLTLSATGPEEMIKKLKARGVKLTFNLADIPKAELDRLRNAGPSSDEISFPIPTSWKKVAIPHVSETPLEIDDPQAGLLQILFSPQELLPISFPIPITIFFPPKYSDTLNPETYTLATNDFVTKRNGIKVIQPSLYAFGVSRTFLEAVRDRIQVVVIASPKSERETLLWNTQFIYPHELEDRYVAKVMSTVGEESAELNPKLREEYLRNRFRYYMNRLRLYSADKKKLTLKVEFQSNTISVTPQAAP